MLRSLAEQGGACRVLISGTANDAMALLVIAAFRDARTPLELTIVDRCETPLALSRWSATRVGVKASTHCVDILDFATQSPFDVITTNSFLSYIEPAARPRLFSRWAALLRRGGKLLFTNRLRPAARAEQLGFTADQARLLCAAARGQAERHVSALGLDPARLEGWVREYAARIRPFPLRSADEILALLDDAGFAPDRVDTALFPGVSAAGAAITGPTLADRADFLRVLATRR